MLIEMRSMDVNDEPVGLSVWEQELYDLLRDHVRSESQVLDRYSGLADGATGHVLYEQWAETVRASPFFAEPEDGVPDLRTEPEPARLIAAIDDLLAFEKHDAQQLKQLDKKLKDVRETTIWPLLVELMALDTRKHIRILEFLRKHAKKSARAR
jgi:hypothetical protein